MNDPTFLLITSIRIIGELGKLLLATDVLRVLDCLGSRMKSSRVSEFHIFTVLAMDTVIIKLIGMMTILGG